MLGRGLRFRFANALLLLATTALALPAHAIDIDASGSTFAHPIMLRWAAGYFATSGVRISYQAIGSGAGVRQVKAGVVAFAASDRPLAADDLKAAGLAQFPLVIGGVVPIVNLEGIRPGQMRLTGPVLADIYLGKITRWNDPVIAALNPGLKLPSDGIKVVHRDDSSGTTFNWVNYLAMVSPEWKSAIGVGSTVKWPIGDEGTGNAGISRYVKAVKGSVGYVDLAHAVQNKMAYVSLNNSAGEVVTPTLGSFKAAAAGAQWVKPDFYELLTNAPGRDAWPIAATVFVLMPRQSKQPERSEEALKFFRWVFERGDADANALNYVAIPDDLVTRVREYWSATIAPKRED